jgi:GNAT superfamily N-acetyltransferase
MLPSNDANITIIQSSSACAEAMERLFIDVFDSGVSPQDCEQCLLAAHFRHHLDVFAEGQFVAVDSRTKQLVGFAVSMLTTYDPAHRHLQSWWQSCGEGWLHTHNPQGDWLCGVESVVEAAYRGQGIGRRLMDARKDLVRRTNLRGIIAGSMPRDYYTVEMPIEAYVQAVVAGELFDTNLSKHLKMGFRPIQIIPNYVIDAESRRYGVLIVWDNPDYIQMK